MPDYEYNIPIKVVLDAYKKGLFPMAETYKSNEIYWVEPKNRGVFFFDKIKIPKKLKKFLKKKEFDIAVDKNFRSVIENCSKITENRKDTWINNTIKNLYIEMYEEGHGHSIECYLGEDLVGGLYGIEIGGIFFGESMFSFVSNASKVALLHLIERLIVGNFKLLDTQFINNHLKQFGAIELSNKDFKKILDKNINREVNFFEFASKGILPNKLYPLKNNIL